MKQFLHTKQWILFLIILAADQITKGLFPTLVLNSGFFLSSFEGLSPVHRVGIIGPFFISFLLFMLWCSSEVRGKFPILSHFIIIFLAAIGGNFVDKITIGAVRDFILLPSMGVAFNLADVAQWISFFAGITMLWKYHSELWPEFNERTFKILAIFKQTKSFLGLFFSISIALCGVVIFATSYLTAAFQAQSFNIQHFMLLAGLLLLVLLGLLVVLLIRYTQRLLGPIKALERWLDDERDSRESPQSRLDDEFGPYQALADKIRKNIKEG